MYSSKLAQRQSQKKSWSLSEPSTMKTFSEEVERYKSMSLLIIFEIGVLPVGPKNFRNLDGGTPPSQGGAMDGKDLHDLGHLTSPPCYFDWLSKLRDA